MDKIALREHLEKLRGSEDEILVASYSGGNDDGYVELDIEIPEEVNKHEFTEFIEKNLGYGSWAGEFEARGDVYWNGKEFTVSGEETQWESVEIRDFKL